MKPNLTDQGEKEVSCPTRVQGVQPQLSQQEPSCGGDDLLGQVSCDRLVPGQDKVHQRQGVYGLAVIQGYLQPSLEMWYHFVET